jgi:hypothetical protein
MFAAGFFAGRGEVPWPGDHPPAAPGTEVDDERVEALEQQLEIALTRSQIDRDALEMVRREITDQKERISDLAEGLRFYKSLISPETIEQGLSLRDLELVAARGERRFAFRIVAQQEARKHTILTGSLQATVFGQLAGLPVSYPLAELTENLDDNSMPLRFRYFQAIEGMMVLPENFTPVGINVVATASKPQKAEIDENFRWRVQERFTNLGR